MRLFSIQNPLNLTHTNRNTLEKYYLCGDLSTNETSTPNPHN